MVAAGTAYFADGSGNIDECAISGCGNASSVYVSGAGDNPWLAADSSNLYWATTASDSNEGIWACPLGASCASPTRIADASTTGVAIGLAVWGDNVYWLAVGETDLSFQAFVYSAPVTGSGPSSTLWLALAPTAHGRAHDFDDRADR